MTSSAQDGWTGDGKPDFTWNLHGSGEVRASDRKHGRRGDRLSLMEARASLP
ncbi:hypothetical protein [Nonomuraea sp. NPDC003709]|uniref:hypothetical protein n=1 Tax=Nonomuraea sp. NPDC003709 TaxID=3154450 RepID=UPI0033B10ACD